MAAASGRASTTEAFGYYNPNKRGGSVCGGVELLSRLSLFVQPSRPGRAAPGTRQLLARGLRQPDLEVTPQPRALRLLRGGTGTGMERDGHRWEMAGREVPAPRLRSCWKRREDNPEQLLAFLLYPRSDQSPAVAWLSRCY